MFLLVFEVVEHGHWGFVVFVLGVGGGYVGVVVGVGYSFFLYIIEYLIRE